MTGIVVQARLDSTRLPRKALLPFANDCLLGHALARLARVPADARVLAVDVASFAELSPVAEKHGFSVVAGPKDDVLARFALVVERFGLDVVVRATGDNPLVSPELAGFLLREVAGADYSGYVGMPLGLGVEVVKAEALLTAAEESTDAYEREHVCPFLYRRAERFDVRRPLAPEAYRFAQGRVTVDTDADYRFCMEVVRTLGPDPSTLAVVRHLKNGALNTGGGALNTGGGA